MKTKLVNRLTLSALTAASSLIALSTAAHAQSVCVGAAGTFNCTDGTVTAAGTVAGTGAVVVSTPQGLSLTSTGDLNATGTGTLNTTGTSQALAAVAVGDVTFGAGSGTPLAIVATGGPGAAFQSNTGSVNATLGSVSSVSNTGLTFSAQSGSLGASSLTTGSVTNVGTAGALLTGGVGIAAVNGPASLLTNGNITATGDAPVGAFISSGHDAASATVNGDINVTGTATGLSGKTVAGLVVSGTSATSNVSGTVNVSAPLDANPLGGGYGILTSALSGVSTTNCHNVNVSGTNVVGVTGLGNDVVIRCGNITTQGDGGTGVVAIATNSIDAVVGNVTTNGVGAAGLLLTAAGPITVTTGNIATAGDTSPGMVILGGTGNVLVNSGTITTLGAASNGLDVSTTSGDIALNTGKVIATGTGSSGIVSTSATGNQVITVDGVDAFADGVLATSAGTGNIQVNATAPVTSSNGIGIHALGTTGTLIVNTAGASGALGGVNALNTGDGAVFVNAHGGVITSPTANAVQLTTLGAATTVIDPNASIRGVGAFDAINTAGALSNDVTVGGLLGVPAGGTGYAVNATGGATTVNVLSTGQVFGPVNLTANADVVRNAGQLTLARTSDFGLGYDTLLNLAGGTLNLNQGAIINGLDELTSAGTTNVVGTTTFTGTTFNNLAAGKIVAVNGASTLAGLSTLNNAGLITLVDGATNDTLTVGGDYVGAAGGKLALDVDAGLVSADKLLVNGNISGVTTVSINRLGAPLYNPTGTVIVDGSGTVSSGAFVLNPANVQSGFLNYGLRQNGNDTFLVNSLDASVTDLALVGTLGRDLWYQSFDAYHDAIMGRHAGSKTTGHSIGIWGQLYESKDKYGSDGQTATFGGQTVSYSDRMKTHRRGGQAGLEYRGPGFVVGVTGGYEWARTEENPVAARLEADGHNYGAYALFGMEKGLYGGVMYKRDDYKVRFTNEGRDVRFRNDAHSDGFDGELGLRGGSDTMGFDLNAGASYVKTHIDPWNAYGLGFSWEDNKSVRGRVGARVIFPQLAGFFVGGKVFHEFKNDGALMIRNAGIVGDVPLAHRGTWGQVEAGLNGSGTNGVLLTAWADVGDTKGFGGRIGFRF